MNDSRTNLRRRLMAARRAVPQTEQAEAAGLVAAHVLDVIGDRSPGVVAGYLAYGGELDPSPALAELVDRGWRSVVPRCGSDASMVFCPWSPGDPTSRNRLGVEEPLTEPIEASGIDVVLVPGVGFDVSGTRIGHGVGFYDRFFAARAAEGHDPLRIGLAHDVQVVPLPEPESWDIGMHHLITPTRVISR